MSVSDKICFIIRVDVFIFLTGGSESYMLFIFVSNALFLPCITD